MLIICCYLYIPGGYQAFSGVCGFTGANAVSICHVVASTFASLLLRSADSGVVVHGE
jgi:hypothetical protein